MKVSAGQPPATASQTCKSPVDGQMLTPTTHAFGQLPRRAGDSAVGAIHAPGTGAGGAATSRRATNRGNPTGSAATLAGAASTRAAQPRRAAPRRCFRRRHVPIAPPAPPSVSPRDGDRIPSTLLQPINATTPATSPKVEIFCHVDPTATLTRRIVLVEVRKSNRCRRDRGGHHHAASRGTWAALQVASAGTGRPAAWAGGTGARSPEH